MLINPKTNRVVHVKPGTPSHHLVNLVEVKSPEPDSHKHDKFFQLGERARFKQ